MPRERLDNPVPYQALLELQRHLKKITKSIEYNYTITQVDAVPKAPESKDLGLNQAAINIDWDVDDCKDLQRGQHVNGYSVWESKVFLDCTLMMNNAPQKACFDLWADIFRYFRRGNTPKTHTLPTTDGYDVIRDLWFVRRKPDIMGSQSKPLLKMAIELQLNWAVSVEDPRIPY